ncbi:MAG: hypothetical protein K9L21_05600, partial [Spirochaetia bacterium]|nr:hypothetical protein [Spirochaetia bacterium]
DPIESDTIKTMLSTVQQIIRSNLPFDTPELQEAVFMRLSESNKNIGNLKLQHHSQSEQSLQTDSAVLFQLAEILNIAGRK